MRGKNPRHITAFLLGLILVFQCPIPSFAAWDDANIEQAENLITNPGFEQGLVGWDIGDYNASPDTEAAYHGDYGLQIEQGADIKKDVSVPKTGEYQFGLNYRTGQDETLMVFIQYTSGDHSTDYTLTIDTTGGEWGRIGCIMFLDTDGILEIFIGMNNSIDLSIDDVCLTPTDSLGNPLIPLPNRISNPDFENGIIGWSPTSSKSVLSWENTAYSGNYSLGVCGESGKPAGAICAIPAFDYGEYEISAFIKTTKDTQMQLSLGSLLSIPYLSVYARAGSWIKLSFYCMLDPNSFKYLSIRSDTSNIFYVDQVSIRPTNYTLTQLQKNQLKNPGFEDGFSNWQEQGAPCAFTTEDESLNGSSCAYFAYFNNSPMENFISQDITATAGSYTYSAYIRPDPSLTGSGAVLELEAKDAGGKVIKRAVSPCIYDSAKGWQKVSLTFNAPVGTAALTAKLGGLNCTGAFYVDSVRLTSALE